MRERGRLVLGDVQSVEHAIEAAARGATLAERGGALVRGVPQERPPLPEFREAAQHEALRDAADGAAETPRVFLACLGPLAEHSERALFASNFFAAGGFDVVQGRGTDDSDVAGTASALAAELRESGASVVCLCGSDEAHATLGPAALAALRASGARWMALAGQVQATDNERLLRDAGVDAFVFASCDALDVLMAALAALDIAPASALGAVPELRQGSSKA
jgi:methylmalonyl-CoA mutase